MSKKPALSRAKKRAWTAMSKYIRLRGAVNGMTKCVTCGVVKDYRDMDAGHFIPKSRGNAIYFEEENVHPQCPGCNRFHEGNKHNYTLFMIDTYGREKIDELEQLACTTVKYTVDDYLEIEREYKERLEQL